jgi:hypothetical protein
VESVNEFSDFQLGELYHQTQGSGDICIAIIDGAVDGGHSDFVETNLTVLNANGEQLDASCLNNIGPSCQHGTFVTGVLAASRESAAPGICPQCSFIAKPIFCEADNLSACPMVTQTQLADAVNECVDAGANIINMSVGLNGESQPLSPKLEQAYNRAKDANVLLVGASGNQASDRVNSIFEHPWVIAVSAVDKKGEILPSANRGAWLVDHGLLAPGDKVTSTAAGGGYKQMTGTSAAAPFVTGAAALLWSLAPAASAQNIHDMLLQKSALTLNSYETKTTPSLLKGNASLALLRQSQLNNYQDITAMTEPNTELNTVPNTEVSTPYISEMEVEHEIVSNASTIMPSIVPQDCGCGGTKGECGCNDKQSETQHESFIYAVGILKPVFPNKGLQQAFDSAAQALKVSEYDYYQVFSYQDNLTKQRPYLYIAAQAEWVLSINNLDNYLVLPRSQTELQQCITALKPQEDTLQEVYSTVIGKLGPVVPYGESKGLLPTVFCDQVSSQTLDALHDILKGMTGVGSDAIQDVIKQLEFSPNAGDSDFSRAKNFVAFRYPDIYLHTHNLKVGTDRSRSDTSYFLASIDTDYSEVMSPHAIVDVIFKYQSRDSDLLKFYYCSVDVTGQYPFISAPIQAFMPLNLN